ncbi:MAG: sigma-70 family RNA polymerase sigma factor [Merismopedia sp. SIO2A8]|nr:sigma-70 family RNA polymerase sigma factor [Merismopedia sp. SIO2A8]
MYEDIYLDALQRLFLHICEHIEEFDPDRGSVLAWANFLLHRRFFIDASREYTRAVPSGTNPVSVTRLSLDALSYYQPTNDDRQGSIAIYQEMRDLLTDDPQGVFRQAHIMNRPDATFQRIALRRLDGFSWHEISMELRVPVPTLSSFYQRTLNQLGSVLRGYLS